METKKIKTLSKRELANLYGISLPTLRGWLSDIPNLEIKPAQKVIPPRMIKIIFDHLGEP